MLHSSIKGKFYGSRDLMEACQSNNAERLEKILKFLNESPIFNINTLFGVRSRVDRSKIGYCTALTLACLYNNTATIEVLLRDKKINVNVQFAGVDTPLLYAVKFQCQKTVSLLLEKGADINLFSKHSGMTPLQMGAIQGNVKIFEMLIGDRYVDLNSKDRFGNTLLYKATEFGHCALVRFLVNQGANPSLTNNEGKTPLMMVATKNEESSIALRKILLPGTIWGRFDDVSRVQKNGKLRNSAQACFYEFS